MAFRFMKKIISVLVSLFFFSFLIGSKLPQSDKSNMFDILDEYYTGIEFHCEEVYDMTESYYGFDSDTTSFETEEEREEYEHEMAEDENTYYYAEQECEGINNIDSIHKKIIFQTEGYWGFPTYTQTEFIYEKGKLKWIDRSINNLVRIYDDYPEDSFLREEYRYYLNADNVLFGCRKRESKIRYDKKDSMELVFKTLKFEQIDCSDLDIEWVKDYLLFKKDVESRVFDD